MDLQEQIKKLLDKDKDKNINIKFIISGTSVILKNNQDKLKHPDLILFTQKEIPEP